MKVPDERGAVDLGSIVVDLRPADERKADRPLICSLGDLAGVYLDEGIPPVPLPVIGHIEGVELPMFYKGLNALGGPAGTAKSLIMKFFARQIVTNDENPQSVLVLDCETSKEEYLTTLMNDFEMRDKHQLERIKYATDKRRADPDKDRWSGLAETRDGEPLLEPMLDLIDVPPSFVVIDSQSKSMALMQLNENIPADCAEWYEIIADAIIDRWPDTTVVMIQGRQKGWAVGMDVRQGRGSSSMLHEVTGQYMVWTIKRGSRDVPGLVEVVCTKTRYGHRVEGSRAAAWHYGPPRGFALTSPKDLPTDALPTLEETKEMVLIWFGTKPREEKNQSETHLPVKKNDAVARMKKEIVVVQSTSKGWPPLLTQALDELIKDGQVQCRRLNQSSTPGQKPERVWTGEPEQEWRWEE